MPGNVEISSSSIPVGACLPVTDAQWQLLISLVSGQADVSVNLHIGEAPPSDLTKAWRKTINGVPEREYLFTSGVWASEHPIESGLSMFAPPGSTLASIASFNGGDGVGTPVTAFTGPMWEENTDFAAMFPIGPGTLPSGLVLNEGDTGGEEKHGLTIPEIPSHNHKMLVTQTETGGGNDVNRLRPNATVADSAGDTGLTGGDPTTALVVPHNNMPVYRVVYVIKRTGRTHYRGT